MVGGITEALFSISLDLRKNTDYMFDRQIPVGGYWGRGSSQFRCMSLTFSSPRILPLPIHSRLVPTTVGATEIFSEECTILVTVRTKEERPCHLRLT